MTDAVDPAEGAGARPDAQRAATAPVTLLTDVGGFRFARVDDGPPRHFDDRERIDDPAERDRLMSFLNGGSLVLATDWYADDRLDPSQHDVIQNLYRTDGSWVWNAAVEYYLRVHHVAPEPEFREWIATRGFHAAPVSDDVVARALDATHERLRALSADVAARRAAARAEQEREAAESRRRAAEATSAPRAELPPDVRSRLEALGWQPGRDVSERVERWLNERTANLAALPFERDGYRRYEPIPAAVAVLNEFGGLVSRANGRGITSAQVPFTIYPVDGNEDLTEFAVSVQMLADQIGARAFQVGNVERGMGALVVDEFGRVFASGPADLYLGADIHEALTRMLQGIRAQDLGEIEL